MGNPLVNELVIGLPDKDYWNTQSPNNETQFASYVLNPAFVQIIDFLLLKTVNAGLGQRFKSLAPATPRNDLVAVFLTGLPGINQPVNPVPGDMLRLNVNTPVQPAATQNPLGVIAGDNAGYPNGRRPGDDVVDIALRVIMGKLYTLNLFGTPAQAVVGAVPFTDGAPLSAANFALGFPFLLDPLPGSSQF